MTPDIYAPGYISTADLEEEVLELQALLDLRQTQLASAKSNDLGLLLDDEWPVGIEYEHLDFESSIRQFGTEPNSLAGITDDRDCVRPTTDFKDLPQPTTDPAQLEKDYMRWGYCIVKDALSPEQVKTISSRLIDQAEAEKMAKVARLNHEGATQMVYNLLPKGQVFRDIISLESSTCQQAVLIERLVEKMLGKDYYLGTAHGSIVHQGGGLQPLHQDQGSVPMPHSEYPASCLIIWTLSEFGLEEGGTYVVPGSHRDSTGKNRVRPGKDFARIARGNLLALTAPAGCCVLTDSRLLHSGGMRTASGTRLALRILYTRGYMRQQENQFLSVPDHILDSVSPKLRNLMGYKAYGSFGMVNGNARDPARAEVEVGELSMSRPEEFKQDFSCKYSDHAKILAAKTGFDTHMEYLGDP